MTTTAPWFVLPSGPVIDSPVVVLGAGLAGCHIAYELARRGIKVLLLDAGSCIAGGASGNSVGIVKPFLTRSHSRSNQFYAAAFNYLRHSLDTNPVLNEKAEFNACGVLQLVEQSYPANSAYRVCNAEQASQIAGLNIDSNAIFFARGGYLNPQALSAAVAEHHNIDVQLNSTVSQINRIDSQWSLDIDSPQQATNETIGAWAQHNVPTQVGAIKCTTLILANGERMNQFAQTNEISITPARGQTSCFSINSSNSSISNSFEDHPLQTVVTGKRYAIPQHKSVVVGATFSRDETNRELQLADHEQNRIGLNALLPCLSFSDKAMSGFSGIRATTPDRLPMVGPVPDFSAYKHDYKLIKDGLPDNRFIDARYQNNLFVIGGFGSRGIVSAPYCAMLLAKQICNNNIPMQADNNSSYDELSDWSSLLHPGRFIIRMLRRGLGSTEA